MLPFNVHIAQFHTHYTQGGNMSGNPYSLRAGLLSQAEGILNHRYHNEYEKIRYLCDRNLIAIKTVTWPTPPTTEDIVAEADKLYKFVQTK